MSAYILVSLVGGFLFGVMDGVIHANPLAQRLYEVYKPIARTSINRTAGILIDLAYGFLLAALFLLLYGSLPGEAGIVKGLAFAAVAWFLRTVMYAASQWMMFKISAGTTANTLAAGLAEMLVLGVLFGLTLKPGL